MIIINLPQKQSTIYNLINNFHLFFLRAKIRYRSNIDIEQFAVYDLLPSRSRDILQVSNAAFLLVDDIEHFCGRVQN